MKHVILVLLFLMAVIAYVQRAAISVPGKAVAGDLGIVADEDRTIAIGWVQSAWYLGYALLQMPSGRLADRLGAQAVGGDFLCGLVVIDSDYGPEQQPAFSDGVLVLYGSIAGGRISMCSAGDSPGIFGDRACSCIRSTRCRDDDRHGARPAGCK